MKKPPIILCALFFAGCASFRPGDKLNVNQASSIAAQLANVKAYADYQCQPFLDDKTAHFMDGHWTWTETKGFGHRDLQATVELAADGSTNSVDIKVLVNSAF